MTKAFEFLLRTFAKKYLMRVSPKKVIVITGSIGKTSTTKAISHVLREAGETVQATRNNYNTNLGVPASVLGYDLPKNAKNPFAWVVFFTRVLHRAFISSYHFDYAVLELGTDMPGDIKQFSWLKPDIAVVTAVAPEHMENFKTIEAVAEEELSVEAYSDSVLVNDSTVAAKYLQLVRNTELFQYSRAVLSDNGVDKKDLKVVGEHSLDALAAALWIAKNENLDMDKVKNGVRTYQSPPGRMRMFDGVYNSTIIDDTYNSSPQAVIAALQYMYSVASSHRIALLGSMNELGGASASLHKEIGEYCNKTKLDLVVTLGNEANKHTAKSAKKNGCRVVTTETPREAAEVIENELRKYAKNDSSIVLCKGSQNGVFAEEAVKLLLKNKSESTFLVRQSKLWKQIKGTFWTTA